MKISRLKHRGCFVSVVLPFGAVGTQGSTFALRSAAGVRRGAYFDMIYNIQCDCRQQCVVLL